MLKTPLYDRHVQLGGTVIDFGGWGMPVQYTNVVEEHRTTREKAGLFDICHMGEFEVTGTDAFAFLQSVVSRNLEGQETGQMKLSVITNEKGGIIDDLTVYLMGEDRYMVVTNAGTKDKDLAWFLKAKEDKSFTQVEIKDVSARTGKLDLQGPLSEIILQSLVKDDLTPLKFYYAMETEILGQPGIVSRSGYTGEDGFEIYADWDFIGTVWDKLLEVGAPYGLKPIGLGARDTLRLEAGMMLYGHEMDETITPLQVVYGWVTNLEKTFIGSDAIRHQKEVGLTEKLVGFEMIDRGIARNDYKIFKDGEQIGRVTSGTMCPTLNKAVGLGFVPMQYRDVGTEIDIQIRDKMAKAKVVKLPFYKREIV